MKPKGVLQTEESKTFFDRILNFQATLSIAMIFFCHAEPVRPCGYAICFK